ncbi:N(G),N(G)-dimethylarginine dimethylaminohydrolase 1-like [Asterias rubens]|uniref:N(G),N(G)-dimethylarginine dimethylaminohydrolase 1-like n=1 Tax=Asterias rubens TaxID=7604 RepID=UPI0014552A10|nr:N(G),N(G)-dimethylarginine dimethylaminohydrolase 1-like [Asterias rubens]
MSSSKCTKFRTEPFEYNAALVCRDVPASLAAHALRREWSEVDLQVTRDEQAGYLAALRKVDVEFAVVEPNEEFPDCVFVEDCAVVVEGRALITRPCAASRRKEVWSAKGGAATQLRPSASVGDVRLFCRWTTRQFGDWTDKLSYH